MSPAKDRHGRIAVGQELAVNGLAAVERLTRKADAASVPHG
jgi:hypothetical protein